VDAERYFRRTNEGTRSARRFVRLLGLSAVMDGMVAIFPTAIRGVEAKVIFLGITIAGLCGLYYAWRGTWRYFGASISPDGLGPPQRSLLEALRRRGPNVIPWPYISSMRIIPDGAANGGPPPIALTERAGRTHTIHRELDPEVYDILQVWATSSVVPRRPEVGPQATFSPIQ
jgi:hypothetical protein